MNVRLKTLVGVLGLSAVGVVALSAARSPFPSDDALRATFVSHRADFERLVVMAKEDSHLPRIAPDFTWLDDDVAWPRKNVGISEQRWSDYKQLFRKIGAPEGILNYTNPTVIMFPIVSTGSVPSGAEKGLAYSQGSLSPILKSLDARPPKKFWNGPDRDHMLAYKPIENHWYIYYEQW